MKKWLIGFLMAFVWSIAFALPSPRQIEDAIASQHYSDARSMVQQVLEEKPDSARAHLLDAFILIHVDHNKQAASQELDNARRLDQRGDVKNSPLFGRTAAEIDMTKVTRQPSYSAQPTPQVQQNVDIATVPQEPKHEGHPFLIFFIFLMVFGVIGYTIYRYLKRQRQVVETRLVHTPYTDSIMHTPYVAPNRLVQNPQDAATKNYVDASRSGLSVQQAPVVHPSSPVIINNSGGGYGYGRGDGFVEGMLIGEMIETRRELAEDRYERRNSYSSSSYDSSPSSSEPATSYASDRQSFSSGSDDSWSSRSSSSDYSSSSSSSSSWDSGSASSSWDSGSSSFDSGSSSGSDW